jgi:hypothetical protein
MTNNNKIETVDEYEKKTKTTMMLLHLPLLLFFSGSTFDMSLSGDPVMEQKPNEKSKQHDCGSYKQIFIPLSAMKNRE